MSTFHQDHGDDSTLEVWFRRYVGNAFVGSAASVEFDSANTSTKGPIRLKHIRDAARTQNRRTIGKYDATEILMLHYHTAISASANYINVTDVDYFNPGDVYNVAWHGGDKDHPIAFCIVAEPQPPQKQQQIQAIGTPKTAAMAPAAARTGTATTAVATSPLVRFAAPPPPLPQQPQQPQPQPQPQLEDIGNRPVTFCGLPVMTTVTRNVGNNGEAAAATTTDHGNTTKKPARKRRKKNETLKDPPVPVAAATTTTAATTANAATDANQQPKIVVNCGSNHHVSPGNKLFNAEAKSRVGEFLRADDDEREGIIASFMQRYDFVKDNGQGQAATSVGMSFATTKIRRCLADRRRLPQTDPLYFPRHSVIAVGEGAAGSAAGTTSDPNKIKVYCGHNNDTHQGNIVYRDDIRTKVADYRQGNRLIRTQLVQDFMNRYEFWQDEHNLMDESFARKKIGRSLNEVRRIKKGTDSAAYKKGRVVGFKPSLAKNKNNTSHDNHNDSMGA